jgi:hypothetical protein
MQLRTSRLCLDCEEIHEEPQCPVCASETFAFLTRWVPVVERRSKPRTAPKPRSDVNKWAQGGMVGLAAIAFSRWLWESSRRAQGVDRRKPADQPQTTASKDGEPSGR